MRADVGHAGFTRRTVHHLACHALVETAPTGAKEQSGSRWCGMRLRAVGNGRALRAGGQQLRSAPLDPRFERMHGRHTERHHALFVTFAGDLDGAPGEIDVAHIQPHQFGHANAGGIQQFEHGRVAQTNRIGLRSGLVAFGVHQLTGLRLGQYGGQCVRALRRHQRGGRVHAHHAMLMRPSEEASHGHRLACHAATRMRA